MGKLGNIVFCSYATISVLIYFFMLVLSYCGMPMAKESSFGSRKRHLFALCVPLFSLLVAGVLWNTAIQDPFVRSVPSWRFAVLLFAAIEISEYILIYRDVSPFLSTLISLKRDILLERDTIENLRPQVEIALLGLKVGDVMAKPVRRFIKIVEQLDQNIKSATDQQGRIITLLKGKTESLSADDAEIICTRMNVIDKSFVSCDTLGKEANELAKKIRTQSLMLNALNPSCISDIEALKLEMLKSSERIDTATRQSKQGSSEIRQLLIALGRPDLKQLL